MEAVEGYEIPKPDLPEWLVWVWRAWHRLAHDRPWVAGGMGPPVPGRIPWDAVVRWCDFHDLPGESVDFLDRCFAGMDAEWMTWRKAQMPK